MTWYTDTCDITAMALPFYGLDPLVKEIYFYYLALDPMVICDGHNAYGWVTIIALLVA
jgi:hypothetical protein